MSEIAMSQPNMAEDGRYRLRLYVAGQTAKSLAAGLPLSAVTGRAELVDFFALATNPKGWLFFWHTITAGFATSSFFILGISAWHHSFFR